MKWERDPVGVGEDEPVDFGSGIERGPKRV
jgi:hypothetical protein